VSHSLKSPIFVVGSPRSGTSILIDGLIAAGYKGFREGNFLPLIRAFERAIDHHFRAFGDASDKVLAGKIDRQRFTDQIYSVFKQHVEELNPEVPWMDKSGNPEMIQAIPVLLRLWPDAGFIFAKRRGIENIASRLKKFPSHSFEYHCRDWTANMSAWRLIRDLPGLQAIEMDQQDMAQNPEKAALDLAHFLNTDELAAARITLTFSRERPQQTEEGSATRTLDLNLVNWTSEQTDMFMRLCWNEMQSYGYSLTQDYWAR
jgi:hypothetical protein